MTKTFEEEHIKFNNEYGNCKSAYYQKAVRHHFKDWHSDEEFQEMKESYWNQAESILSMLEEIKSLKSQLQQQALPVVPECVAGTIESIPDNYSAFEAFDLIKSKVETLPEENKNWLKVYNWLCEGIENQDIFALAFITRKYQVEKPQLFYLKNKITGMYLSSDGKDLYEHHKNHGFKFTQEDINSLDTGSYEQIEVTE